MPGPHFFLLFRFVELFLRLRSLARHRHRVRRSVHSLVLGCLHSAQPIHTHSTHPCLSYVWLGNLSRSALSVCTHLSVSIALPLSAHGARAVCHTHACAQLASGSAPFSSRYSRSVCSWSVRPRPCAFGSAWLSTRPSAAELRTVHPHIRPHNMPPDIMAPIVAAAMSQILTPSTSTHL